MKNIIVLFEVKPTKAGMQKYLDLAAMLKPLLAGFEGFIRAERFSSLNEEGKLLSMNVWTDEAAVERWRNVVQHRMSQKEGQEELRRYEARCHYNDMNVLSMHALIGAYTTEGREWMQQLKKVLENNIELADTFFREYVQGVSLRKPEGTYVIVPDFTEWCR